MKYLLFFICFIFCFLQTSKAIPAEQKQNSEQKQILQIAILKQNEILFEGVIILQKKKTYIIEDTLFACFYGYLRNPKFHQKPSKKPCKIPIKPQTRNKDNI